MSTFITTVGETQTGAFLLKWQKLLDNAKYLSSEHRHKEKEYGISWRTAFKTILRSEFERPGTFDENNSYQKVWEEKYRIEYAQLDQMESISIIFQFEY